MPSRPTREPPSPDRFEEAIRWHKKRAPVTEDEWDELTEYERQRAFKVAGVTQARVVQQVHEAIDRAVADGSTLDDFKEEVGDALVESWGGSDPHRVEGVFRTNVLRAYNEGRREIFDDPEVRKARPYKRFDAVGDSRMCEICEPLDGTIMDATDPFWRTHLPPLHPGCRCVHVALSAEEAEDEGGPVWTPPDSEPPPPGFGVSEDYDVDFSSFPPEIARVLRERLERGGK